MHAFERCRLVAHHVIPPGRRFGRDQRLCGHADWQISGNEIPPKAALYIIGAPHPRGTDYNGWNKHKILLSARYFGTPVMV